MKFLGFIVLFLYVLNCYSERAYNLRFRNSLLRVYIVADKKKIISEYSNKIAIKTKNKTIDYYNKILSKFHDFNLFYSMLTEEEKNLIDAIVLLYY